jgi:hypothetical protein
MRETSYIAEHISQSQDCIDDQCLIQIFPHSFGLKILNFVEQRQKNIDKTRGKI